MGFQLRVTNWLRRNQRTVDILLFLLVLAIGLIGATWAPVEGSERETDWLAYVFTVAAALPMLWRRTAALAALAVAVAVIIPYWVLDYPSTVDIVLWMLFYAAGRHGGTDRRRVWTVVGICLAAVVTIASIGVAVPEEDLPLIAVFALLVIYATAAVIGEALYQRSQYIAQLEQRALALEADLDTKAELAAVEERTRIAREMHDIIAHGMSSIVVQAQGAQRLVDRDPERTREVLSTIENIGRNSVDEMRRMLGVLRDGDDDAELAPQPGFDDLEGLRRHVTDAGVDLSIEVRGEQRPLPPGLELAGYRLVQEALTNVMRHAGRPVRAEVTVDYRDDRLDIEVVDDGLGAAASPTTAGTGHGVLGMRERIEIYNGTFTAGPRPGGGFRVATSLPLPTYRPVTA